MMETRPREVENPLCDVTTASKPHVSKQLPTKPKLGILHAVSKQHETEQLILDKYNHFRLKKNYHGH